MTTPRIVLAGLFHETHTFLSGATGLSDFQLRTGTGLLLAEDDGSPLAGVMGVARTCQWTVLPAIDLRATPSATVDDAVVERFWDSLRTVAEPEIPRGLDAFYLVLHGAMASQSYPDVEGEILRRIHELCRSYPVRPLVAGVLDLHCNYSAAMAQYSDLLIAYRENPHTDAQAAAIRSAELLNRLLKTGQRPTTVWEQAPLIWPPTGQGTANDPMRWLEREARQIEQRYPDILAVNVLGGYAFADTLDTGLSFSAVTLGDPEVARAELRRLVDWAVKNRDLGNVKDTPIEQVMPKLSVVDRSAINRSDRGAISDDKHAAKGPILLVEPADNIGGGAPGDGTGVLRAFLEHGIENAAVVINDPAAVQQIANRKLGSKILLAIGGHGSPFDRGPVTIEVELVSTSDGRFDLEDRHSHLASMCGVHIDMGPCAVVRHAGITILLTSRKTPPFDLGQLRSQGIVPEDLSVIGVKAAVAHRRAYDPIARESHTVDTPGPCSSNLKSLPYRKIRRPVFPLDAI